MGGGVVAGSPGPAAHGVATLMPPVPGAGDWGTEVTPTGHHHGILTEDPGPLPRPLKTECEVCSWEPSPFASWWVKGVGEQGARGLGGGRRSGSRAGWRAQLLTHLPSRLAQAGVDGPGSRGFWCFVALPRPAPGISVPHDWDRSPGSQCTLRTSGAVQGGSRKPASHWTPDLASAVSVTVSCPRVPAVTLHAARSPACTRTH